MKVIGLVFVLFVNVHTAPLKKLASDSVAREKFFPLAAAAYSDEPEDCIAAKFKNATLHRKVIQLCGDGYHEPENCFGYTAVNHDDRQIIIAFRGTRGLMQLLFEGQRTVFKNKIKSPVGGQVSDYFESVYRGIMDNGLKASLQELFHQYNDYGVWVTGHSLGGALASIAVGELIKLGKVPAERVTLITFGQPRVGDYLYAYAHDDLVKYSWRITHSRDLVPHIPPLGFEHYRHHKSEVFGIWYDNDMTVGSPFVECDEDESNNCSNGKPLHISIPDHLYYYNVFLTDYGISGCTWNITAKARAETLKWTQIQSFKH
ncbi:Lipase domain containing protein [Aphelenchoides besseyi]|nr:Lipase domain containing protein [Aphelenchoides besseyi]KAI6208913.1 Lipase domain containing protein [Aphelenchoides besseyi]